MLTGTVWDHLGPSTGHSQTTGLFFSSRTDNQIVALILTVLVCGALYLVGTSGVTGFVTET